MSVQRQGVAPAELHPLSIVRMFWKRKLVIGLVWILGSIVTIGVVWKLPPVYKSEALILVDSQKIPDRYVTATVSTEIQDRIATIGQQIMSTNQLRKIIDDFGLYKEQRGKLFQEEILEMMRKDITIRLEKGWTGNRPGAFRIGFEGPDPVIVSQVANRLANLYIEENLRVREVQAAGTSEFIETQLAEAKKKLDGLEAAVSQYKLKHNGELPEQENTISSELTRYDLALQANRDEIRRSEESLKILQNTLSIGEATVTALSQPQPQPTRAGTDRESGANAGASQVLKKSDVFRVKLAAMKDAGYADGHPDVKYAKEQLASALEEEAKEAKDAKDARELKAAADSKDADEQSASAKKAPSATGVQTTAAMVAAVYAQGLTERERLLAQMRERVSILKTQIEAVTQEIQDRKADQPKIVENINVLQSRLGSLPVREQEMAGLTRDYEISKANYRALLDKNLSAEMATDMERRQKSERFTLLDPAHVPEKPASPNRPLFAGIGLVLALGLGAIVGFGLEIRKHQVLGEWELAKGVAVLGRIPFIDLGARSARGSTSRTLRKLAVGLGSAFLLAVIAAGYYVVRSRF